MKKRSLSVILAIILTTLCVTPAFATAPQKPPFLRGFYTDNMLFKQKDEVVIAGTGTEKKDIAVELINSKKEIVAKASEKVNEYGDFEISFTAPEGSYEEYTIIVKEDGKKFATLKNVVFGH